MLPNSFYSSSELGLCFPPFEVQNPNPVIATLLQTPAFFTLLCFDTSSVGGGKKKKSEVWVVHFAISEGCFFFFFNNYYYYYILNWGLTSEGLCFIIGFYEVFKKKSFKQRLCLAYLRYVSSESITHQYISHGAVACPTSAAPSHVPT